MRRVTLAAATTVTLTLLPLVAAAAATAAATPTAAAPPAPRHVLRPGHTLQPGDMLVSRNGHFRATLTHGRLVVANRAGHWLWATPRTSPDAVLRLGTSGQLKLVAHHRTRWAAGTAGSGAHEVLRMRNDGTLALLGRGGLVWSDARRNACPDSRGRSVLVDVSGQWARACRHGQQLRFSRVTTGASALGDGTPLGRWRVQAKVRDTTLYPAAGGAYPVKFWVPYDGAYGFHDASWQTFPYGSPKYRRHGSHGCVHVPGPMMRWLFGWFRVGTAVTIRA